MSLEAGGAYRVGRTRRPHFLFSVALLAYELKMLQVTQGRSRSLEITPMSRACVSTYQLSIVDLSMCLYLVPIMTYSAPNIGVTLESMLRVIQGHLMTPFDRWDTSSSSIASFHFVGLVLSLSRITTCIHRPLKWRPSSILNFVNLYSPY